MERDLPTLAQVDAFKVPDLLITRLQKKYGYSEQEAYDIIREAKRMLFLHRVSQEPVVPSLKVDDGWHEMLMFTESYRDFCNLLGAYIHHVPTPDEGIKPSVFVKLKRKIFPPQPIPESKLSDGACKYKKTKENFQKYLHITPNPKYWP